MSARPSRLKSATAIAVGELTKYVALERGANDGHAACCGGVATIVREIVVKCARSPLVPTTVTVEVPVDAFAATLSVNCVVVVADGGVNDAVTPDGRLLAEKLTEPLKPPEGMTETVYVPDELCATVCVGGFAAIV